jgi:hypothetical protein
MKTPQWITAAGDYIPLAQMSTEHAKNVMVYILRGDGPHGPLRRPGCSGFTTSEWLELCKAELNPARPGRPPVGIEP